MPRIETWSHLPPALRDHLIDRMRDRNISLKDLNQLRLWMETTPEVPEGRWYKDFGSFKLCGEGKYPKTFLLAGQTATGRRFDVPFPGPPLSTYNRKPWFLPLAGGWYKVLDWVS